MKCFETQQALVVAAISNLMVAMVMLFPATCLGQSKTFSNLALELNSTEGKYQQATTDAERIEILQKSIAIRESLLDGIPKNDPKFNLGSDLETATPEKIAEMLESVTRSTIDRRFSLSKLYQEANRFQETADILGIVVSESEALDGAENINVIEYKLKLEVANWLNQADEASIAKWNLVVQKKRSAGQAFQSKDYDSAIASFERATATLEELKLTKTMSYGEVLANHAEVLLVSQKTEQAEAAFKKAIEVNDALFHKEGSVNANMRRSFSNVFSGSGRYEEAIAMLDQADALYVSTGNGSSFDRAYNMYLKGTSLQNLEKYKIASRTYYDSVNILIELNENRLFGPLQKSVNECYQAMNDVTEPPSAVADEAAELGLAIFEGDKIQAVNWMLTIAKGKLGLNELDNCNAIYERTEQLLQTIDGHLSMPLYLACVEDLTNNYQKSGDLKKAITFAEKAVAVAIETSGDQSMKFAMYAQKLTVLYSSNGEHEKAEALFEKFDGFLENDLGESNTAYLAFSLLRADNLHKTENWEAAISRWVRLRKLQSQSSEVPKEEIATALGRLAEAYEKSGQTDLASKTREELKRLGQ